MKKIFVLLIPLILLTGCEAVYNVEISDNINDELVINNYDISSWNEGSPSYKKRIDGYYESFNLATDKNTPGYPEISKKLNGYNYYNKELINTNNNYGLKFNYSHEYNDYSKTPLLLFYGSLNIKNYSSSLIIDSGNGTDLTVFNGYKLLDKLTINITSNYAVSNNNADEVNDNKYTWIITKDSYKEKNIHIEIDKSRKIVSIKNQKNYEIIFTLTSISLVIVVAIFILLTFIKIRKSNK